MEWKCAGRHRYGTYVLLGSGVMENAQMQSDRHPWGFEIWLWGWDWLGLAWLGRRFEAASVDRHPIGFGLNQLKVTRSRFLANTTHGENISTNIYFIIINVSSGISQRVSTPCA